MRLSESLAAIACVWLAAVMPAARADTVLEAAGPAGPLKGALVMPQASPGAVVLIIPGSGPTDRDGNSPAGLQASTYRLLAEGLGQRGVASLRIDKRGMFGSAAATPDPNAVTIADYAVDVRAWVDVLRRQTSARCVWLLGHSEGGLVALATAKEESHLCGLILVAAPGRPLAQVLREQLKTNPANAPILGQALTAIDALERGQRVDVAPLHPALQGLFNPAVQGFLISAFSYDPQRLLAAYDRPVLVVQGQRDLQVSVTDAQRLIQAHALARLALIPNANHVLKAVNSDDRGENLATYANPRLPLAPGVLEAIADFVLPGPKAQKE